MNLTISGHHVEVTPPIRAYVQSKLDRIKRNLDGAIDIMVILAVDNNSEKEKRHRAELSINISGKTLHVSGVAQDLYAAIDMLTDKLERQIIRHKTRTKEFSHESVKRMNGAAQAGIA